MAEKQFSVMIGDKREHEGKTINVYDTYANALLHASGGLVATVINVNKLTGASAAAGAITQVAKTTGLTVDQFGMLHFYVDDGNTAVWLMSDGHWGPPRKVYVSGV